MRSHDHVADDGAASTDDAARVPSPDTDHRFPHPIAFLVVVAVFTLVALAIHQAEPNEPGPYYTPPAPLPAGQPGSIIKAPQPISGTPAGTQGWLFMYQSTGMNGQPIAVTATVFVPTSAPPPGGRNVVAWAHPTTGIASRCAPSLEAGGGAMNIPGLLAFIQAGDAVVATDYPGLGTPGPHPYLVGTSEGMSVLDSARAVRAIPQVGASGNVALWGHSQGGQAALFAAALAPTYAPDLQVVGVAAAAPATDLTALLQKDLGGLTGNVLGSMAVVSWSEVYPGAQLGQVVSTEAIPLASLIADYCIETEAQMVVDLPEAELQRVSFISNAPWTVQPWQDLLVQNTPGVHTGSTTVPNNPLIAMPVLINQGTADTVVWPNVTASWAQTQCQAGQSLQESTYDGVTHTNIGFDSAANTAAWIADRFAGQPVAGGCATTPATFTAVPYGSQTTGTTPGSAPVS